jgi:hypothetical protein
VSGPTPPGWEEVFRGPCLEADLVHAVLQANGLEPVQQQLSPQVWWSGSVLEDCRVYVLIGDAEAARRALAEREPDEPDEPGP